MKYSFARLRRSKDGSASDNPGLFLLLVLIGWVAACVPTAADTPAVQSQPHQSRPYTFYLDAWTVDNPEDKLVPLDPETLGDQSHGQTLEPGIRLISADGSTGVNVEYPEGRANLNLEKIWIVIYDLPGGIERSRFHPPARVFVAGLSADGDRLLLQPDPTASSTYPPIAEWYVVDTASGELLAHIQDADNACFRQYAQFDPAGKRIYCLVDPALVEADEPQPVRIVAYDVATRLKAEELELPEALIGGTETDRGSQTVWAFLEPAAVLSPDGQQLALVHADADKVTLIDAHSLTVERTFSVDGPTNLWDLFGFAPATAHAKGEMQGTIRHAAFSPDGQNLYVFTQEVRLVTGQEPPEQRGLWLVDLEQERIAAESLPDYQIQWVQPAPDGAVYVFGTTDERLGPYEIRPTSPSTLWRLDGLTLDVLAERPFTGYRSGHIVVEAATKASTLDCPVTQPPETAFIPPEPWPAQPPGKDQFWYGENGLWTALPASGSWRQLALGEKFWWWSGEFDVVEDSTPDLVVTARRLDGDAPVFQTTGATNGYHESFHWAMLAGVELPTPGCWEFTGQYSNDQLSFVLWVPPE